jgi:hypothetical protein
MATTLLAVEVMPSIVLFDTDDHTGMRLIGKGGRNRKKKTKTQSTQQERGSVLAVANSNTAADNLLEGLLACIWSRLPSD